MRLSMFSEHDVREAARRVLTLSREQHERVIGFHEDRPELTDANPYVEVFASLYKYARGTATDDEAMERQLGVAESMLGNPLFSGAQGAVESPLLMLVLATVRARRKLAAAEELDPEEEELLR